MFIYCHVASPGYTWWREKDNQCWGSSCWRSCGGQKWRPYSSWYSCCLFTRMQGKNKYL